MQHSNQRTDRTEAHLFFFSVFLSRIQTQGTCLVFRLSYLQLGDSWFKLESIQVAEESLILCDQAGVLLSNGACFLSHTSRLHPY